MKFNKKISTKQKYILISASVAVALGFLAVLVLVLPGIIRIGADDYYEKCRFIATNASQIKGYSSGNYGDISIDIPQGTHQQVVLKRTGVLDYDYDRVLAFSNSNSRSISVGLVDKKTVVTDNNTTASTTTTDSTTASSSITTTSAASSSSDTIVLDIYGLRANTLSKINYSFVTVNSDGTYNTDSKCPYSQNITVNVLNSNKAVTATPSYQVVLVGDVDDNILPSAKYQITGGTDTYKFEEISKTSEGIRYSTEMSSSELVITPNLSSVSGEVTMKISDANDSTNNTYIVIAIRKSPEVSANGASLKYSLNKHDQVTIKAGEEAELLRQFILSTIISKNDDGTSSTVSRDFAVWASTNCYSTDPNVVGISSKSVNDTARKADPDQVWKIFGSHSGSANIICSSGTGEYDVLPVTVEPINLVIDNASDIVDLSTTANSARFTVSADDYEHIFLKTSPQAADSVYDQVINQYPDVLSLESVLKSKDGVAITIRGLRVGKTGVVKIKHADMSSAFTLSVDVTPATKALSITPSYQAIVPEDPLLGEAKFDLNRRGAEDIKVEVVDNPSNMDVAYDVSGDTITVSSKQVAHTGEVLLRATVGEYSKEFGVKIAPSSENDNYYARSVSKNQDRLQTEGDYYVADDTYDDWTWCYSTDSKVAAVLQQETGRNIITGLTKVYSSGSGSANIVCAYYNWYSPSQLNYEVTSVTAKAKSTACKTGQTSFSFVPNSWNLLAMPWGQNSLLSDVLGVDKTTLNTWSFKGLNNTYEQTNNFTSGQGLWFNSGNESPICVNSQQGTSNLMELTLPYSGFNLLTNPTSNAISIKKIQIKVGIGLYYTLTESMRKTNPVATKMVALYDPNANQYSVYINKSLYPNYVSSSDNAVVYDIMDLPSEMPPYSAWWVSTYTGGTDNQVSVKYSN